MSSAQRPPNHLLQALPAAEFELVGSHLKPLRMVTETALMQAGAALTQIVFPDSGAASIVVRLSEGQTVAVAMIGRDGVIGAFEALGEGRSLADVIVLFPGTASGLDLADFRTVSAQSPALRRLLICHGQALLAQAQQTAACNAAHTVEARLSRWLLRAHDLHDHGRLPLTQELLAQMIGVRRNAISIVAHALQEAGIIRYRRGQIEIVDIEALRARSCECHAAADARQEQLRGAVSI